jgi:zinc resistance-associated protein
MAMWKALFVGVAAVVIAGSSLVFAQQPAAPDAAQQQRNDEARRWRPTAEDLAALVDARVAALKTGLKLTPEQERHWPAVETAIRTFANERLARVAERRAQPREQRRPADPIERLRRRAEVMSSTAAGLRGLADAAEPLYRSLDDGQKRRFTMLARSMASGARGISNWRARGGPGPQ